MHFWEKATFTNYFVESKPFVDLRLLAFTVQEYGRPSLERVKLNKKTEKRNPWRRNSQNCGEGTPGILG
jgi:hypothetical protein